MAGGPGSGPPTRGQKLKPFRNEKGQTTIIVALAMVLLFGFVALSVDVGRGFFEVESLQRTADLSAISGAEALKTSPGQTQPPTDAANLYANLNTSTFRTGQNFASTGCEELYVNAAVPPAVAPPWTPPSVGCSAPHLFSGNCTNVAGVYSCPEPNPCMDKNGVQYQCVYTRAASRNFHFLFAPVTGAFGGVRTLSGQATAVLGSGAPGGKTLIPWMLRDCPGSQYDGAGWSQLATNANAAYYSVADGITDDRGRCSTTVDGGYQFSGSYTDQTRWTDLFAPGGSGTGGNFGGVGLQPQSSGCPPPNSYFPNGGGPSGAAAYSGFLAGTSPACSVGTGGRVVSQNGVAAGPTRQAWTNDPCPASNPGCPNPGRGVSTTCLTGNAATDQDQFNGPTNGAVTVVNQLTGEVKINHLNPCLIAVLFVTHTSSDSSVTNQSYLGTPLTIPSPLQFPDTAGCTVNIHQMPYACVVQRFAPPGVNVTGGGTPLLVRRVAFFYLTQLGDNNTPYAGIFLKAVNNYDETLNGPADPTDSISVVKLVS
jgi:Putative Flp pilus-assembly TadE/G-like